MSEATYSLHQQSHGELTAELMSGLSLDQMLDEIHRLQGRIGHAKLNLFAVVEEGQDEWFNARVWRDTIASAEAKSLSLRVVTQATVVRAFDELATGDPMLVHDAVKASLRASIELIEGLGFVIAREVPDAQA